MAQQSAFITLAELLDEQGASHQEDEILGRLKLLAQENLPDGWTRWEVSRLTKEEVFGDKIDPNILNKITFALPTVGIVRAFDPEADHLSEKGYREMRIKLIEWAFTRALIIGPPAIANKIRGSVVRTELFKEAIVPVMTKMHTRREADKILAGLAVPAETARKRRATSASTKSDLSGSGPKKSRLDLLEERMNDMFECILSKIHTIQPHSSASHDFGETLPSDEEMIYNASPPPSSDSDWDAPSLILSNTQGAIDCELEFRPETKEADPPVPTPTPQISSEGTECQRFSTERWNRIRYKEAEQRLHAAPVFYALKVNAELGVLGLQSPENLAKQDTMLGTTTHGLLRERKALRENLQAIAEKHPSAAEDIKKLLAKGSEFRTFSDDVLQYVCGHRAEVIEMRRNAFKGKNDVLSAAVRQIPPSATHLFEATALSGLLKENGGATQVFQTKMRKAPMRGNFRKPEGVARHQGTKNTAWRPRPGPSHSSTSVTATQRHAAPNANRPTGPRRAHQKKRMDGQARPRKY